jgi:hypothetical protein
MGIVALLSGCLSYVHGGPCYAPDSSVEIDCKDFNRDAKVDVPDARDASDGSDAGTD